MVSKARDDLPDPLIPVITTSWFLGISKSTPFNTFKSPYAFLICVAFIIDFCCSETKSGRCRFILAVNVVEI